MLGDLNPSVERLGGVFWKYRNAALAEDCPGIDTGIDEVDRAAGLGHPGF